MELTYFNIVNIRGITPQATTNQPIITPAPQQVNPEPVFNAEVIPEQTNPPAQEQESPNQVPSTVAANESVPSGGDTYGMMGVPSEAANDGFTIVLFSLRVQQNAYAKQQELAK